ncbi:hypothetical protein FB45DRAFT_868070 [Roridomyces roridus]|uniref:Uncharacterized protein n=1 Tax=Roridomyces roridus TaxID=1738132 RepID=A0AAD7FLG6_9AGAR|nr:hypothetical protein FB45DRAFT_868070 [Roridomyces roridus]
MCAVGRALSSCGLAMSIPFDAMSLGLAQTTPTVTKGNIICHLRLVTLDMYTLRWLDEWLYPPWDLDGMPSWMGFGTQPIWLLAGPGGGMGVSSGHRGSAGGFLGGFRAGEREGVGLRQRERQPLNRFGREWDRWTATIEGYRSGMPLNRFGREWDRWTATIEGYRSGMLSGREARRDAEQPLNLTADIIVKEQLEGLTSLVLESSEAEDRGSSFLTEPVHRLDTIKSAEEWEKNTGRYGTQLSAILFQHHTPAFKDLNRQERRDRMIEMASEFKQFVAERESGGRCSDGSKSCATRADSEQLETGILAHLLFTVLNVWQKKPNFDHFLHLIKKIVPPLRYSTVPCPSTRGFTDSEDENGRVLLGVVHALCVETDQDILTTFIWDNHPWAIGYPRLEGEY